MKYLKLTILISALAINASAFATGSKREPPQAPNLLEQIMEIFTIG